MWMDRSPRGDPDWDGRRRVNNLIYYPVTYIIISLVMSRDQQMWSYFLISIKLLHFTFQFRVECVEIERFTNLRHERNAVYGYLFRIEDSDDSVALLHLGFNSH